MAEADRDALNVAAYQVECLRQEINRLSKQPGSSRVQDAKVSLHVTIESMIDPLCPWTYIGHLRMVEALASSSHIVPNVLYVPYIFDDETPMPPLPWKDYMKLKFPDRVDRIMGRRLTQTMNESAREGIVFADYVNRPICEVISAFRLLKHCQENGQGQAYIEALMISHFEYNLDISHKDVIKDCVMDCGLDSETVDICINDDSTLAWVLDEHSRATQMHKVKSVPHYVIKENSSGVSISISGAEKVDGWIDTFDRLRKAKVGSRILNWPL